MDVCGSGINWQDAYMPDTTYNIGGTPLSYTIPIF
jgi:hypothetical protein